MSSPTTLSLPPGPGASGAARSAGPGRTADRGTPEAFGSALEDALAGTGTPSRSAAGRPETGRPDAGRPEIDRPQAGRPEGTPDDVAADAPTGPTPGEQPDAARAPAGELPPGIWALLNAIGSTTPAASAPTDGTPAGIVPPGLQTTGAPPVPVPGPSVVPVAGVPGPVAELAADGPTPPSPTPAGHPTSVTDQLRGTAADALARAAGLTVVAAPADGVPASPVAPVSPAPASAPGTTDGAAAVGGPATSTPAATGAAGEGADGLGTGTGSGAAAPAPAGTDRAPADDATTGVPGAAQPAPGVAPAPAAVGPATARETPVAAQLAPQLAVLRNAPDGSQTMTLVLTPDSLGEVTIQVTITDGTLDLMLRGGSEHGRHALADALPELRRDLEGAGLSFSRLAVDPDAPRDGGPGSRTAEQQLADMRGNGGQQQRHDSPRSRAWAAPGAPFGEAGPVPTAHSSASSGVDVRV